MEADTMHWCCPDCGLQFQQTKIWTTAHTHACPGRGMVVVPPPWETKEAKDAKFKQLEAELEAAKNGYQVISLLMDMQRACPVACKTSIHIETEDRDPVVFRWEYKMKGQRMSIEIRISWLELRSIRGKIYFDDVNEQIKASTKKGKNNVS